MAILKRERQERRSGGHVNGIEMKSSENSSIHVSEQQRKSCFRTRKERCEIKRLKKENDARNHSKSKYFYTNRSAILDKQMAKKIE